MNLQDKIPKRAKEMVSNHTGKDYSLNIASMQKDRVEYGARS
jgi:hypothetical protein